MKIFYLEYRIVHSTTIIKKPFASAENRDTFITTNKRLLQTAYLFKMDYVINSQAELIEMLNNIL